MKFKFYTPVCEVEKEFGAATLGFAGAENENVKTVKECVADVSGVMVLGTYDECLSKIPSGNFKACIVLIGNAGNENEFIKVLKQKINIPVVGGSAAINGKTGETALITGRGQTALFFIDDERYDFSVECKNIHYDILGEHIFSFGNKRIVDKIDGVDALKWYNEKREAFGISADDFEHLTFSDEKGINVHLSEVDGKLVSGRDVQEKMILRYIPENEVQQSVQEFYDDENAIVFGCAGLKKILTAPLKCDGIGMFMFGEICTKDGHSEFGNLMLSKLKIIEK